MTAFGWFVLGLVASADLLVAGVFLGLPRVGSGLQRLWFFALVVAGFALAVSSALAYRGYLEREFVASCHAAGGHVVRTERDHVCVDHNGRFLGPSGGVRQ